MTVNLENYLEEKSTYLSGLENGQNLRKLLKLDKVDKTDEKVEFFVSSKMTGISNLFFRGLFWKSVKKLKIKKFQEKYIFRYEDEDTKELVKIDVDYGTYSAMRKPTFWEKLFKKF